jgi:hypothetical protein
MLVAQQENRGRQVYGLGTQKPGATPPPAPFEKRKRDPLSMTGVVLLLITATFTLWGLGSAGRLLLGWLGW